MTAEEARRLPNTIERLSSAVLPAYALLAGMQLEVFTALAEGPASADEAARRLGVRADKLSPLLWALVAVGLLEGEGGRFANTAEADEFLVRGRPRYLGDLHQLWSDLWRSSLLTAQSIRRGSPQAKHDFSAMTAESLREFLGGMYPRALAMGRELARRFDFSRCRSVIDIGGGSGGTVIALCERHPELSATLFDLPPVAAAVGGFIERAGLARRIAIEAGNIVAAPPRGRHDAAILCALVQVLGPEEARLAVKHACAALNPGGAIYIMGRGILDDARVGPPAAVFINVTFLNIFDSGRSYTESEHRGWLGEFGCADLQRVTLPDGTGIIRAVKSAVD